jgi:hypothetical protein
MVIISFNFEVIKYWCLQMLKKYKNELYNRIQNKHIPLTDFLYDDTDGEANIHTFSLVHIPTNFRYIATDNPNDWNHFDIMYTLFAPEFPIKKELNVDNFALISRFINWLEGICDCQNEILTPDLWTNITDSQNIINETDKESLEYFTSVEQESVRLAIRDFKQLIEKKFEMDSVQHAIVSERLDYLAIAVDRLNKFDWKGTALNTIISISITLSLNTDNGRQLFELFKTVFGSIVRMLH